MTSIDVARAAGVSQSAVSRTFAGTKVSEATQLKVLKAARELGYRPNAIARSLIMRRSNIVGIVMGDLLNPFYPAVLDTLTAKLQRIGLSVLFFSVMRGRNVDEVLPLVLSYQVDALILTSVLLSSVTALEFKRRGTPVVLLNRTADNVSVNSVCTDNVGGGRIVGQLFQQVGFKRCAFIAGVADTSTNVDRRAGFMNELARRGLPAPLEEMGHFSYEGGHMAAMRLLQRDHPPEAIFCANDIMALGALDAARNALRLKVPDDVSIIGFDDIPPSSWSSYDLTTLRQPIEVMVNEAVATLARRIERPDDPPDVIGIPPVLIRRSSCQLPSTLSVTEPSYTKPH